MKRLLAALSVFVGLSVQAQTFSTPQVNSDWNASSTVAQILNKPTLSTVATTGNFADLLSKPTTLAGYGITDGVSSSLLTTTLTGYATTTALSSGLNTKFSIPTGTTSQYVRGDGTLATLPSASVFNFSQPTTRTLAVSTSYQASDTTKAAILYPSYACQNATTVLAASGCTIQVRMGTGTLTCSTGTVYYTQSLTVALGLLITQNSTNPVPIFLPVAASFILCPTTGTFTVTAVEQSAG